MLRDYKKFNKELFEKNYKDVSSDDKGLKTFELLGENNK
jgi:hypothetical protein